ncbi:MAG: hypothetical protein WCE64_15070 [Bacteroidales bacterium]
MNLGYIRWLFILLLASSLSLRALSQSSMPEVLTTGTLTDQMNFITEKTRIYEDFRAIREDMFQKLKGNALDSLSNARNRIAELRNINSSRDNSIAALNDSLGVVNQHLDKMINTKNSITLLGIEINKSAYNAVMWSIIAALAGILAIGFMIFKRNIIMTSRTRKEFEDLKKEFEAYRRASREAREKMSMTHFNELKRMRGA